MTLSDFEFGKTYSYLSTSRIEGVADAADVPASQPGRRKVLHHLAAVSQIRLGWCVELEAIQ
jgi:hypothetical protein